MLLLCLALLGSGLAANAVGSSMPAGSMMANIPSATSQPAGATFMPPNPMPKGNTQLMSPTTPAGPTGPPVPIKQTSPSPQSATPAPSPSQSKPSSANKDNNGGERCNCPKNVVRRRRIFMRGGAARRHWAPQRPVVLSAYNDIRARARMLV